MFTTNASNDSGDAARASSREWLQQTSKPKLVFSAHAHDRLEQRHIDHSAIHAALDFGEWFYAGKGRQVAYLSRRALLAARASGSQRTAQLKNLAVVISEEGTVLTAYRAKRPLKHWRGTR